MTLEKLQVIIEAQTKAYYDELQKMQTKTKQTTSAVEKQTDKIKSAFGKIGKAVAAALSVTAIINFSKSCIELGSNLAEVQNVVDVTFGDMSDQINRFARDALTEFGLSETSAKKYTSTMGAMLKSMGLTTEQAADMSMTITGLSADMASFYNLDNDVAFEKIRSGISGETEPLKQLGINMSVANLQAYALSQGITKAYSSMTQQEQAMLRYNYLLSVTADAQGDFARTSDGWANQVRVLTERFNALKAAIGQGLIAVLTPVIRVLNNLLSAILTVTDAFSNMIAKITGKNTTTTTTAVSGISDSADDATDSVDSLTDATDSAGSSAKKASQEYAGLASFDEIHSLTKSDSSSDSSDSSSASSGLSEEIVEAATETDESLNPVLDKLTERLKELKDLFKEGFEVGADSARFKQIELRLAHIKETLKGIFSDPEVTKAADNFANHTAYALGQMAGAAVSIGTNIAVNIVGGIDRYLTNNQDRIKQYIIDMFDIGAEFMTIQGNFAVAAANIFSAFGGTNGQKVTENLIGIFTDAAMGVNEIVGKLSVDIIDVLTRPIIDNQESYKAAFDGILEVTAECLGAIKDLVDGVVDSAIAVYDTYLGPSFDKLAAALSELRKVILDFWNGNVQPMLERMADKFKSVMEKIQPMLSKVMELIGSVAALVTSLYTNVLVPIIEWLINTLGPVLLPVFELLFNTVMTASEVIAEVVTALLDIIVNLINIVTALINGGWSAVWEAAGNIVNTIMNAISQVIGMVTNGIKTTISTFITTITTTITTKLTTLKTSWTTIWTAMKTSVTGIFTSMWTALKGTINSIIGGVETMANSVVNGINTVIDTLNSLSFTIPDWVPGFGGKTWSMNIPKMSTIALPKLATGGIVDGATPLIAGEAGAEAIVPLERNTGWMNTLGTILGEIISVNVMSALEGLNTSGDTTVQTYVQIDGKTIVEQVDKYKNRQGYSMSRAVTT